MEVTLIFRGEVILRGPVRSLEQGRGFSTRAQNQMQMVLESDWAAIVDKGTQNLATVIAHGLTPGSDTAAR